MTLHIGIASWQNSQALKRSIEAIQQHTAGDFKLLIVDNNSPDPLVARVIAEAADKDPRILAEFNAENRGYVGAVNQILAWADAEDAHHIAYVDNDAFVQSPGWNIVMTEPLDRHHEVAMSFPRCFSSYVMTTSGYNECLWGLGCCWLMSVARYREIGPWDETLGHQNECDTALRLHLAGWKLAAVDVAIEHKATATKDPAAQERITQGVIQFVDKWNKYFAGPNVNYFSPNVLRWEDWPPVALYLERYFQRAQQENRFPLLNRNPEQVTFEGRTYDLVCKPRHPHLYRDRLA